jgi:cytochrome c553
MRSLETRFLVGSGQTETSGASRPAAFSPINLIPPNMKTRSKLTAASLLFCLGAALSYAAPASENWENSCTKCHGADGKGQTKIGKKLSIKDYTDAKVQADLKDADITKAITEGIKDKNGKEKMKAFSDFTPAEVQDLVAYIRKFKS